ncbi:TonB-dependent receptor [Pedobacter frigiditerrae]|uniref:TonB-dependent receptor n=1 Tax=Pedobacter frigiditerrae TaxID=2530452 RepID=A0A4R0N145_9SPHI|nr:TonB-dependent receptor plug domain-containing protein [Pedobacter frigiditerrae]TCC93400.1 TonB-dependent receptor [Pedobacter frigiditerrae]
MKTKFNLIVLSLLTIIIFGFKIDDTPLEKLLKQLAKITATYPQEKIHLHFDKPYYVIGEDIWFKAYVVTAEKNEPSLLSKVLYVDLINNKNQILKKSTISMDKGFGYGNFSLLDSLGSGTYKVRAYTNYMRNYDDQFFFEKFVTIGNILDPIIANKTKEKKVDLDLQFFPEGGNLIKGIRSKIGVKAVTSDGLGANLSGYIINRNKEKVAEFKTVHAGMGIFALTPQASEKYTAIVTLADGTSKLFDLPSVMETGYALAVNAISDNINIRISSTADLVDSKDVYVVAQANGVIYASFTSKVDKPSLSASIPKKNFPTGMVHITLFNSISKPVAERLIFVNHNDELRIEIKNTENAIIKKKSTINMVATDISGNPVDGSFSVAVTDVSKVAINEDEEKTILSNLLLTSDLKGFIEMPNYYFNTANADRESHLDNLLLTQGWRRFLWQDLINEKDTEITFRPEQSLEIAGKVSSLGNKPMPNAKITMFSKTKGYPLLLDTVSDANGNFVFDMLDIPDSAAFILQAKQGKDNKNINLKVNPYPVINNNKYTGNAIDISTYVEDTKTMFNELNKFNLLDKGILLNTVNIVGIRALKPLINIPNSANASGAADRVVKSDQLAYETNILTAFSKIGGVLVKNGMIYRASNRTISLTQSAQPMLIILDGVYVKQAEQPGFISSMNPLDIEGIEVLTSNYNTSVYGEDGYWGIVYITTKNGSTGVNPPSTNTTSVRNRGFTIKKEFYSPNYDDPKINQQMLDLRSTIYWDPNVNTDAKGIANFSYFSASSPTTYRIIIEGMDAFGNIGRKIFTYKVGQPN